MSVARITEITAMSPESFDAAIREALGRASDTLRNVTHAWVKDQEIALHDGAVSAYKVTLRVTFVLD